MKAQPVTSESKHAQQIHCKHFNARDFPTDDIFPKSFTDETDEFNLWYYNARIVIHVFLYQQMNDVKGKTRQ